MKRKAGASRGFTLVELLISVAIGIVVMAALIEVFSQQQKGYAKESQLVKEQQAARTAMSMLSRDIRMAGYTGAPLGSATLSADVATYHYFPVMSIQDGGTNDVWSASSNAGVIGYSQAIMTDLAALGVTSDAIEIRGNFNRAVTTLASTVALGAVNIPVDTASGGPALFSGTGFNQAGWIAVAQTGKNIQIEIYPINGPISGNNVPIGKPTTVAYAPSANVIVAPIYSRVYYATPDVAALGNNRRKLWAANYVPNSGNTTVSRAGTAQEFAVDVDDFQVRYNLDVVGAANQVVLDQNMLCDPCSVRSVTLNLWTAPDPDKYNHVSKNRAERLAKSARTFTNVVQIRNVSLTDNSCTITSSCGWEY